MNKVLLKADLFEVLNEEKPTLISDNSTQFTTNDFKAMHINLYL